MTGKTKHDVVMMEDILGQRDLENLAVHQRWEVLTPKISFNIILTTLFTGVCGVLGKGKREHNLIRSNVFQMFEALVTTRRSSQISGTLNAGRLSLF